MFRAPLEYTAYDRGCIYCLLSTLTLQQYKRVKSVVVSYDTIHLSNIFWQALKSLETTLTINLLGNEKSSVFPILHRLSIQDNLRYQRSLGIPEADGEIDVW